MTSEKKELFAIGLWESGGNEDIENETAGVGADGDGCGEDFTGSIIAKFFGVVSSLGRLLGRSSSSFSFSLSFLFALFCFESLLFSDFCFSPGEGWT